MVTDLHTALEAAITARLEVARAATPGPWTAYQSSTAGYDDKRDWFIAELARFRGHLLNHVYFDDDEATARHIALHDPGDAVRRYERDLKVLKRHSSNGVVCDLCSMGDQEVSWPCDEIADLLDVYRR